jgi:centromere/kinetochore protein ZW10
MIVLPFLSVVQFFKFQVCHIILQAIEGADGFQNTHQSQHYESARFSIEKVHLIAQEYELLGPRRNIAKKMSAIIALDILSVTWNLFIFFI